jgi:tetratricopeptide (TPR) repeat protein
VNDSERILQDLLSDLLPHQTLQAALDDGLATTVIGRLETAVVNYRYKNAKISVALAEEVTKIGKLRECDAEIALGTMLYADSLWQVGSTNGQSAWDLLEQAAQLFEQAGDKFGWARTRIGRLLISYEIKRSAEAFEDADIAEKIFEQAQRFDKVIGLRINRGHVLINLGYFEEALQLLEEILEPVRSMGELKKVYLPVLLRNIGHSHSRLGHLELAKDYYQQAIDFDQAHDQASGMLISLYSLAWIAKTQGEYQEALRLLNKAKSVAQSESENAYIDGNVVRVYLELNRFEEAASLAEKLVQGYEAIQAKFEGTFGLVLRAYALEALQQYDKAMSCFQEALALFQELESQSLETTVELDIGRIALKQENPQEAIRIAKQTYAKLQSNGQMAEVTKANLLYAAANKAAGNLEEAFIASEEALQTSLKLSIPTSTYSAQYLLGQICAAQSDFIRAAQYYDAATQTIWEMQQNLAISFRPDFLEDKHEAAHALIQLYLWNQEDARAFTMLERLKAQIVLGEISNQESLRWQIKDEKSEKLFQALKSLRAEYQFIHRLLHPSPLDERRDLSSEERKRLRNDNRKREKDIQSLVEQLYIETSSPAKRRLLELPSVEQIQAQLRPDETLIEYYDDGKSLWAFVMTKRDIHGQRLPLSPALYHELLDDLQNKFDFALDMRESPEELATLEAEAQQILYELYCGLLAPLMGDIPEKSALIIVPYEALHYLPFSALFDGQDYLVKRHEIRLLPAASMLLQASPKHEKLSARVIANSWNKALVSALDEARMVHELCGGELYLEEECQISKLDTSPCKILHIAAHGEYHLNRPELSFIQFHDEQIFAYDLFQRDMRYELVVLSACETGRNKLAPGDELIGLGRGFLYAGAGALVSSLWQVEGDCTSALMQAFYENLLAKQTKAEALSAAQRQILQESGLSHPIFWAAFQVIGNNEAL